MLNPQQKKRFRALAHDKKPLVTIGANGLTDAVIAELNQALHDHELVKVRVNAADREQRSRIIERLGSASRSELVQRIGHVAVFYKKRAAVVRPKRDGGGQRGTKVGRTGARGRT